MRKPFWTIFVGVFLFVGFAAAVQGQEIPKGTRIKIAGFPGGGTGFLLHVMEKEGLFKKHGLMDVRLIFPEKDIEAFAYGAIEAAFLNSVEVANLRIRGWEAAMVGPGFVAQGSIWAKPGKPYRAMTDMKGKKLAQYGWDSGMMTSLQVLGQYLYKFNVRDEVQHVLVPPPATKPALDRGDAEFAIVPLGVEIIMRIQNYTQVWGPMNQAWLDKTGSPLYLAALAANEKILDKPGVIRALKKTVVDGVEFVNGKPKEAMAKYRGYFGYDDARAAIFVKLAEDKNIYDSRWDEKTIDAQWELVKTAAELKLIINRLPPGGKEGLLRIF